MNRINSAVLLLVVSFLLASFQCHGAANQIFLATRSGAFDQFGKRDWSQRIDKYRAVYMNDSQPKTTKRKKMQQGKHKQSSLQSPNP